MTTSSFETSDEDWVRDWGVLLRTARQVSGMSLTQLSKASGLSKGYLSKLESGHLNARNPSRSTLAALAKALPTFNAPAHILGPHAPSSPAAAPPDAARVSATTPLLADSPLRHLEWDELEAVLAVFVLERAALPVAVSAVTIARVLGRPVGDARLILDRLVETSVLATSPTAGAAYARTSYRCSPKLLASDRIPGVGEALLLAGAGWMDRHANHSLPVSSPGK